MNKPKSIAVTRVKNEIDIIEAFVRHHAHHFDRIIAADDGSTDGTYEALLSLQSEGLPLVVLRDPTAGYNQRYYLTKLVRIALDRFGADWIAPLDADEFIEPPEGTPLAEILAASEPTLRLLPWVNFLWTRENNDVESPVERLVWRLPARFDQAKVLIPAECIRGREFELWQGNHGLNCDGKPQHAEPLDGVVLCHFPVRSVGQYASKIAIGYLQYAADSSRIPGHGYHYDAPYQALLSGLDAFKSGMEHDSGFYSMPPGTRSHIAPTRQPLRYMGGPSTGTPGRVDPIANVLNYAAYLAWTLNRVGAILGIRSGVEPDDGPCLPRYQDTIPDMHDPANALAAAVSVRQQLREHGDLVSKHEKLERESSLAWSEAQKEIATLREQYDRIQRSASWRITKPVRVLGNALKYLSERW